MREIIEEYGTVIVSAIIGVLFVGIGCQICGDFKPIVEIFLSSMM